MLLQSFLWSRIFIIFCYRIIGIGYEKSGLLELMAVAGYYYYLLFCMLICPLYTMCCTYFDVLAV
jgi:hypothetical protein